MNKLLKIATDPKQYDRSDVQFSGIKGLHDPHRRHFLHYIESVHPIWKGENVLDIGAGSGWSVKYIGGKGAKHVVGFDPSSKSVAIAKKVFNVKLIETTLERFTFPKKNYFDIAIALYVLTHVYDLDKAFKIISTYIKPGGEFITVVSDPEYAKRPKPGVRKDIEYLKNDKYNTFVIRSFNKTGTIADIVRDPQAYVDSAKKHGLELEKQIKMKPSDHLADAYEKHKKLQKENITLSLLLQFKKRGSFPLP